MKAKGESFGTCPDSTYRLYDFQNLTFLCGRDRHFLVATSGKSDLPESGHYRSLVLHMSLLSHTNAKFTLTYILASLRPISYFGGGGRYFLLCSTNPPGGNLVDGLPPAPNCSFPAKRFAYISARCPKWVLLVPLSHTNFQIPCDNLNLLTNKEVMPSFSSGYRLYPC